MRLVPGVSGSTASIASTRPNSETSSDSIADLRARLSGSVASSASSSDTNSTSESTSTALTRDTVDISRTNFRTRIQELSGQQKQTTNALSYVATQLSSASRLQEITSTIADVVTYAQRTDLQTTDRATLQATIDGLYAELDAITQNTSGAGIAVALQESQDIVVQPAITTGLNTATNAAATIDFTSNFTTGQTIRLNGTTFTAGATNTGTTFRIGASIDATVQNLLGRINAQTTTARITQASYSASGTQLTITADAAGAVGNLYVIDQGASTGAANFTVNGNQVATSRFALDGGLNGSTTRTYGYAASAPTETILVAQNISQSESRLNFASATNVSNNQYFRIDDGNGGTFQFTFKTAANPSTSQEVQIGTTLEESIQNAVSALNSFRDSYSGTYDYTLQQVEFSQEGTSLVVRSVFDGTALDSSLSTLNLSESTAGTLSSSSLGNGTTAGVNTLGVTNNSAFVGVIDGFSATYTSANRVTLSVTVGDSTYTSTAINTASGGTVTARLESSNGGYFDIQLVGGQGSSVANQAAANSYAARINTAFSSLAFAQRREITSASVVDYNARFEFESTDFSTPRTLEGVSVIGSDASGTNNASISLTINGQVFTSSNAIGKQIGEGERITLVNASNPREKLYIINGDGTQDVQTDEDATALQTALEDAFGYSLREDVSTRYAVDATAAEGATLAASGATAAAFYLDQPLDVMSADAATSSQTLADHAVTLADAVYQQFAQKDSSLTQQALGIDQELGRIESTLTALTTADDYPPTGNPLAEDVKAIGAFAASATGAVVGDGTVELLSTLTQQPAEASAAKILTETSSDAVILDTKTTEKLQALQEAAQASSNEKQEAKDAEEARQKKEAEEKAAAKAEAKDALQARAQAMYASAATRVDATSALRVVA